MSVSTLCYKYALACNNFIFLCHKYDLQVFFLDGGNGFPCFHAVSNPNYILSPQKEMLCSHWSFLCSESEWWPRAIKLQKCQKMYQINNPYDLSAIFKVFWSHTIVLCEDIFKLLTTNNSFLPYISRIVFSLNMHIFKCGFFGGFFVIFGALDGSLSPSTFIVWTRFRISQRLLL